MTSKSNELAIEQQEIRVGYLALTDCAPVVVAAALGFDRKYGIRIVPSREPRWAAVRDKLLGGALDAAQLLYGLVYGVELDIAGPRRDMAVLDACRYLDEMPNLAGVASLLGCMAKPPARSTSSCPIHRYAARD